MTTLNLDPTGGAPEKLAGGCMTIIWKLLRLALVAALLLAAAPYVAGVAFTWYVTDHIAALPFANPWLSVALWTLLLPLFIRYAQSLLWPGRSRWAASLGFTAATVVVSLVGFVWTSGDNFDANGKALRAVVFTPDGVKLCRGAGVDPVSGEPCVPLTPVLVREIRAFQIRGFFEADPVRSSWFGGAGQPLLWFSRRPGGEWHFYSQPSYDPRSGAKLQAVIPESRQEWEKFVSETKETAEKKLLEKEKI